jgi:hypothetical protein
MDWDGRTESAGFPTNKKEPGQLSAARVRFGYVTPQSSTLNLNFPIEFPGCLRNS